VAVAATGAAGTLHLSRLRGRKTRDLCPLWITQGLGEGHPRGWKAQGTPRGNKKGKQNPGLSTGDPPSRSWSLSSRTPTHWHGGQEVCGLEVMGGGKGI
jgi:hypothetical protein